MPRLVTVVLSLPWKIIKVGFGRRGLTVGCHIVGPAKP
jgi:hypothetical protein